MAPAGCLPATAKRSQEAEGQPLSPTKRPRRRPEAAAAVAAAAARQHAQQHVHKQPLPFAAPLEQPQTPPQPAAAPRAPHQHQQQQAAADASRHLGMRDKAPLLPGYERRSVKRNGLSLQADAGGSDAGGKPWKKGRAAGWVGGDSSSGDGGGGAGCGGPEGLCTAEGLERLSPRGAALWRWRRPLSELQSGGAANAAAAASAAASAAAAAAAADAQAASCQQSKGEEVEAAACDAMEVDIEGAIGLLQGLLSGPQAPAAAPAAAPRGRGFLRGEWVRIALRERGAEVSLDLTVGPGSAGALAGGP